VNGDWQLIKPRELFMRTHKDLEVWRLAINFAEYIYTITRQYPREEIYGLVSQIRRAAVSISANISEGAARRTRKEFIQFLYIARASASELDTLLEISKRTNMTEVKMIENARQQNIILTKMLSALIKRLNLPANHQSPITNHHSP
jgi:four helix bundle protein